MSSDMLNQHALVMLPIDAIAVPSTRKRKT